MKRILLLILTVVLLLSMCACSLKEMLPSASPETRNDSYVPGSVNRNPETHQPEETMPQQTFAPAEDWTGVQQFTNDAGTSIDVVREEIGKIPAYFGVAYLGYFNGVGQRERAEWMGKAVPELVKYYPFVPEIDDAHTVGGEGHLYCVIAQDFTSSIEVTSIADGEVLYQSQNGDPILVYCNRNNDVTTADYAVTITLEDGTSFRWEPTLDELEYPNMLIGNERELLSWDFMPYEDTTGFNAQQWIEGGWLGPTKTGLAGDDVLEGQTWQINIWDSSRFYTLSFCPNGSDAYDGEAVMACYYDEEHSVLQAEWQGWWRIQCEMDQPSILELDLMLLNGEDKAAFENSAVISETYQALIPLSGESLLLVTEDGSAQLPLFPENEQAVELLLKYD